MHNIDMQKCNMFRNKKLEPGYGGDIRNDRGNNHPSIKRNTCRFEQKEATI